MLIADSSASTGLSWAGPEFVAGRNKILNSDFSIWQRGTSFTLTNATETYCADRFRFSTYAASGGLTGLVSQQAFTPGTAPVAGYEGTYFARLTNSSSASAWQIRQRIEDVRTLAGQTVTFSFWVKASVSLPNTDLRAQYVQVFGTGGSTSVAADMGSFTISTSWERKTFTVTLPSVAGKTIGAGSYLDITFYQGANATNSSTIDTWGWQLEAGSVATPFTTATGTLQGERAACQYYYQLGFADTRFNATVTNQAFSIPLTFTRMRLDAPTAAWRAAADYSQNVSNPTINAGITATDFTTAVFRGNCTTTGDTYYGRQFELVAEL